MSEKADTHNVWPGQVRLVLVLLLGWIVAVLPAHGEGREETVRKVTDAALAQTQTTVRYDAAYVSLPYPGGDVPLEGGVCTDVIVRAFRAAGVDLQRSVHEDMAKHFSAYPKLWSLRKPDSNIDHRRVPNLMTFFTRSGKALPVTQNAVDYQPGDVVSWIIPGGLGHIGLVAAAASAEDPARHLMIHNIGAGAKLEDVLFTYKITGHYRYF